MEINFIPLGIAALINGTLFLWAWSISNCEALVKP